MSFSIKRFASKLEAKAQSADDKLEAVREGLAQAMECYGSHAIIEALQAAVPGRTTSTSARACRFPI